MNPVYLELSPQYLRQIAALVASLCMYSALPSTLYVHPRYLFHVGSTSAKAVLANFRVSKCSSTCSCWGAPAVAAACGLLSDSIVISKARIRLYLPGIWWAGLRNLVTHKVNSNTECGQTGHRHRPVLYVCGDVISYLFIFMLADNL